MSLASNPFEWRGPEFLLLYAALLALAILAGLVIPRWLRPEGQSWPVKDPEALAYLAGGSDQMIEAAIAALMARGALVLDKRRFQVAMTTGGRTPTETSLLNAAEPLSWPRLRNAAVPHIRDVEQRLVAQGLIMSGSEGWQVRLFQTLPYALLLGFGLIKLQIGLARDRPVGFLIGLLIVTGAFALIRLIAFDRRTRGGQEVLVDAKVRAERLNRAPTQDETGLAVALFGTGVLAVSALAGFHELRARSRGSDGGGGCSGGGDGGGGGGGGCGGCGGD